jgi:hypothetical protein
MIYMYALFVLVNPQFTVLQSFETMEQCEVYKAQVQKDTGALGRCLWMEPIRV